MFHDMTEVYHHIWRVLTYLYSAATGKYKSRRGGLIKNSERGNTFATAAQQVLCLTSLVGTALRLITSYQRHINMFSNKRLFSLVITLLSLESITSMLHVSGYATCKTHPNSPDWPDRNLWTELNHALGGRLLTPAPPGGVCHSDQSTYNAIECPVIAQEWSSYQFHADNPVSVMWDNWSNWTCLPDARAPCSDEGYPVYVVNATTAEHVKLGVDFGELKQHFPHFLSRPLFASLFGW